MEIRKAEMETLPEEVRLVQIVGLAPNQITDRLVKECLWLTRLRLLSWHPTKTA